MRPPYEVTHTSALVSNLGDWKASEYRAFALYYLSALEDFLQISFFFNGLQVLLQGEVAVERVQEVDTSSAKQKYSIVENVFAIISTNLLLIWFKVH